MDAKSICRALVGALITAASARAASYAYVPIDANYSLTPGQTATVGIYITETTDGVEPSIIGTQLGLYSGEVRLSQISTTAATPTKVLNLSDIIVNAIAGGFDAVPLGNELAINGTTVDISAFAEAGDSDGVFGTVASNVRTIKLADVTFTAGTVGTTVVQLIDGPLGQNTVTFDPGTSTVLDGFFATNGPTITFDVIVPEPASATVLMGLALLTLRRRVPSQRA